MAVARSSVFLVGRNQNASWPIRRRRRSATDMPSELGMRCARQGQGLHRRVAADAAELLAHERRELGPVSVRVDDRMVQAGAKLAGLGVTVGEHGWPLCQRFRAARASITHDQPMKIMSIPTSVPITQTAAPGSCRQM